MKVQILQENFSKALTVGSRFVSNKAQLPILSNVLIKAEKTKLHLLATNLEVSFATSIGAKVTDEGSITMGARTLTDLVSNLDKGAIEIETVGEEMKITNSRFSGSFVGIPASDFPTVPESIGEHVVKVKKDDFISALSQVVFAASHDETRPILNGVLFIIEKKRTNTCDNRWLSFVAKSITD